MPSTTSPRCARRRDLANLAGRPPHRRHRRRHDRDRHRLADQAARAPRSVTIVYRRGQEQMNASAYEQELAQTDGVLIRHWLQPKRPRRRRRPGWPRSSSSTRARRTAASSAPARRSTSPATSCSPPSARPSCPADVRRRPADAGEGPDQGRCRAPHLGAGHLGRRRLRRRRQGPDGRRRRGRQAGRAVDRPRAASPRTATVAA